MITDALLAVVSTLASWIDAALPDGHLSLPSLGGLGTVLGKVDSLVPIAGPLAAAVLVLSAVVVFVALRLILVLWNLVWP